MRGRRLIPPVQPLDWQKQAACRGMDTELFYAEDATDAVQKIPAAKAVCADCEVRSDCLDWALRTPDGQDFGVLGGLTAVERRKLRSNVQEGQEVA